MVDWSAVAAVFTTAADFGYIRLLVYWATCSVVVAVLFGRFLSVGRGAERPPTPREATTWAGRRGSH